MISMELMIYCIVAAGGYLLILSLLYEWVGHLLNISRGIPPQMMESTGTGWFLVNYIMELLFFVVIPTLAYSFLYLILPLDGLRAGLSVALLAFALGATPILMGLSLRIKLSMPYLLYILLGLLLKLGGALLIIGYLYTL